MERIFSDYLEKGLQQGLAAQTLRFLRAQLGSLDAKEEARIRAFSQKQLERLGDDLPGFRSHADLTARLRRQTPQKTRKRK